MASLNMMPLNISDADLSNKKSVKKITDYMYQLTEQLRFTLNTLSLEDISDLTGNITKDMINAKSLDDMIYSRYVLGENAHFKFITAERLVADYINADEIHAKYANIEELTAADGYISDLRSDLANIGSVLAGNIGTGSLQSLVINSVNATIANATIKSAMIESINTDEVKIRSADGRLQIADNTIQIQDASRMRVQIGKDAGGDYNMYVWDVDGNLMFDAAGIHPDGIKDAIIRNDMVASDANISAAKIFVEDGGEKLSVLFSQMGADVGNLSTSITAMNGKLESVISDTELRELEEGTTLYSKYSAVSQDLSSYKITVSEQFSTFQTNEIDPLITRMSSAESTITQLANNIELKVSQDGVIAALNLSPEGVKIQGDKIDLLYGSADWRHRYPYMDRPKRRGSYNSVERRNSQTHYRADHGAL